MAKEDYYVILGVVRTASDDEIKKAYRKMAVQYHPDRNPGDKAAEEKFKEINEAYQVLSDAEKRSRYDQFGHSAFSGGSGFGGFEGGFGGGSFTDIFDNIFGDIFGGGQGQRSSGVDLRYNLEITFEEAAFGVEKEIHFEKESACTLCSGSGAKSGTQPKMCKTCRGTGQVRFNQGFFTLSRPCSTCEGRGAVIEEKCPECRGKGKIRKPHKVVVKIPAGIDNDQRLRIRGEGESTDFGGNPGDLFVHISVKEHALFQRQNEHIVLEMPITFTQAALGDEIDVPTLQGKTSLKIPSGTQSGTLFRLKGKGIKRLNGTGSGDQVVQVTVEVPSKLNHKQKELLKQFHEISVEDSHPTIARFIKKLKEILK
jgi:molecular chaperone DnaJ